MEKLRLATKEDMTLLFQWANDRNVRNASFCTEPITWETHVEWFQQMMESQDILQFIYECDDKAVGQVRLRIQNEVGFVSYSIASEYRGNGKATQMLTLLENLVKKEYPQLKELAAEVKCENMASRKVFEKLEYVEKVIVYKKKL